MSDTVTDEEKQKKLERVKNRTERFTKTRFCPFWRKGSCKRGSACNFAHRLEDIRDSHNLFKTRLCEQFLKSGNCTSGDTCRFAHGQEELREGTDTLPTATTATAEALTAFNSVNPPVVKNESGGNSKKGRKKGSGKQSSALKTAQTVSSEISFVNGFKSKKVPGIGATDNSAPPFLASFYNKNEESSLLRMDSGSTISSQGNLGVNQKTSETILFRHKSLNLNKGGFGKETSLSPYPSTPAFLKTSHTFNPNCNSFKRSNNDLPTANLMDVCNGLSHSMLNNGENELNNKMKGNVLQSVQRNNIIPLAYRSNNHESFNSSSLVDNNAWGIAAVPNAWGITTKKPHNHHDTFESGNVNSVCEANPLSGFLQSNVFERTQSKISSTSPEAETPFSKPSLFCKLFESGVVNLKEEALLQERPSTEGSLLRGRESITNDEETGKSLPIITDFEVLAFPPKSTTNDSDNLFASDCPDTPNPLSSRHNRTVKPHWFVRDSFSSEIFDETCFRDILPSDSDDGTINHNSERTTTNTTADSVNNSCTTIKREILSDSAPSNDLFLFYKNDTNGIDRKDVGFLRWPVHNPPKKEEEKSSPLSTSPRKNTTESTQSDRSHRHASLLSRTADLVQCT